MTRDILSIGDIVTDVFIKLNDADARCDLDNQNCKLILDFADKIPYESAEECVAVGNSANAAVAAARLGLSTAILTYTGSDWNGSRCRDELERNSVGTEYVRAQAGKKTNYHYALWYKDDRTILVKHEKFDYQLEEIEEPKWVYLSSLGENSESFHNEIADYLEKHPEIRLAFQPGTFQIMMSMESLARIYKRSDLFVCNVEEAQKILGESKRDMPTLMKGIAALGPKLVSITDGVEGAYGYDGEKMWFVPIYPQHPFERTGAGDAFSSTLMAALALGKTFEEALLWAPINSMSVVRYVGAQKGLLKLEELEDYINKAPEDYKLREL